MKTRFSAMAAGAIAFLLICQTSIQGQSIVEDGTLLCLPPSVEASLAGDSLGDFVATYAFERTEQVKPPDGAVSAPSLREHGEYEVARRGNDMRITIRRTSSGGAKGDGSGPVLDVDSGESWLFHDDRLVATIFNLDYTANPDAHAILEVLPPLTLGLDRVYRKGELQGRSARQQVQAAQGVQRSLEQRDGRLIERGTGSMAIPFAHGTWVTEGIQFIDPAAGRVVRQEAGRRLTFAAGGGAYIPSWIAEAKRWVDGVPARVEYTGYQCEDAVLDGLDSPTACVNRYAEPERIAKVVLTMELTNFRLPTATDKISRAEMSGDVLFVRPDDEALPTQVWSGAPGESTRLMSFNASSNAWEPATAQP